MWDSWASSGFMHDFTHLGAFLMERGHLNDELRMEVGVGEFLF